MRLIKLIKSSSHSKSSKPSIPSASNDATSASIARDKFGTAKAISSDQFFGPKESEVSGLFCLFPFRIISELFSN